MADVKLGALRIRTSSFAQMVVRVNLCRTRTLVVTQLISLCLERAAAFPKNTTAPSRRGKDFIDHQFNLVRIKIEGRLIKLDDAESPELSSHHRYQKSQSRGMTRWSRD